MTISWMVGQMINIFNSTFENSLRVIILLSNSTAEMRQERIVYLDFITCYSHDFGFSENINGNNSSKKAEISLRRAKIEKALHELVVEGFVKPIDKDEGHFFEITIVGKQFSEQLSSNYANKYRKISKSVITQFSDKTDKDLLDLIFD